MIEVYSPQQVKKILESTVALVQAERDLGFWESSRANDFAREQQAEKILRKILPEYKKAVPLGLQGVINISEIEKRCKEDIQRIRGINYSFDDF